MRPSQLALLHAKVAEHYHQIDLLLEQITNLTQQPEDAKPSVAAKKPRAPQQKKATKTNYTEEIQQTAISLAVSSGSEISLTSVLEVMTAHGSKLGVERSKPTSLIAATLSRTPGFAKTETGTYKYSKPEWTE
jgi:hypothetical protein